MFSPFLYDWSPDNPNMPPQSKGIHIVLNGVSDGLMTCPGFISMPARFLLGEDPALLMALKRKWWLKEDGVMVSAPVYVIPAS